MGQAHFSEPVFLKLHRAGNFRAGSAAEAVEYIEHHWQGDCTPHYRQAKVLCHAAVDGIVAAETARLALVDAARRSGILADGRLVDGIPTNTSFIALPEIWRSKATSNDEVTESDFLGYSKASDILNDPTLSPSRKRVLLAYWASDLHAVSGAPALRSVQGVTVTIDSLFDALCKLDVEIDQAAMASPHAGRGQSW